MHTRALSEVLGLLSAGRNHTVHIKQMSYTCFFLETCLCFVWFMNTFFGGGFVYEFQSFSIIFFEVLSAHQRIVSPLIISPGFFYLFIFCGIDAWVTAAQGLCTWLPLIYESKSQPQVQFSNFSHSPLCLVKQCFLIFVQPILIMLMDVQYTNAFKPDLSCFLSLAKFCESSANKHRSAIT